MEHNEWFVFKCPWLPLHFLSPILGGGKVERLKSTISTDHSSDTSQQVGFLYQMTKRSEHSGLHDNPTDQKYDVKTDTVQAAEPVRSRKTSIPFISKFVIEFSPVSQLSDCSLHGCCPVGWYWIPEVYLHGSFQEVNVLTLPVFSLIVVPKISLCVCSFVV